LAVSGDVGDDAEVVSGVCGVTKLLEVGGPTNEHVVEPRGECDGDKATHRRGVHWLTVGTLPRLLVPSEAVDASGVAGMKTDEAGTDQVAILPDVEAGDEVVVVNVALRWRVPTLGNLTEVFFKVGDDVLETGNL